MTVNVGLVGTSWWADMMYMPQLNQHPLGKIEAVCGRNLDTAQKLAEKWKVPHVFTDYSTMIKSGKVNAVIVATPNDSHYLITMAALEAGLHVLCEKPLAMNYGQAQKMAALAEQKGVKTLTAFTWSYHPNIRYLKELIETGYIGKPYHCNMRWYASGARNNTYQWRLDTAKSGSGVLGDLGSHYIHMASWLFGGIRSVSCSQGHVGQHPSLNPDGNPYELADDSAIITLAFENGAHGTIHVTYMAYGGLPFSNLMQMEFHGSEGTVSSVIDFDKDQHVHGGREGEPLHDLPIPEHILAGANLESFGATIGDVFGKQETLARAWVTAIAEDKPLQPDLGEGAAIQRIVDAAIKSHEERRWVEVQEIQ